MAEVIRSVNQLSVADREWLRIRQYFRRNRHKLAVLASEELYPDVLRVADTPLLTAPEWIPDRPIPLGAIRLDLDIDRSRSHVVDSRVKRYSERMRRLDAPVVFENRRTYRLLAADLQSSRPSMVFGLGRYFDGIDVGEAIGHEYAAQKLGISKRLDQRTAVGSPVDPRRRPVNIAISALTIRHERENDNADFLLHWRDPAKVGHGGGLYHVVPVGVFQPVTDDSRNIINDFSLWHCLTREYAEELLGEEEIVPAQGTIDYGGWTFAAELRRARENGTVRGYCLGMGVDPLTLATDLLCAVVVDAAVFDQLFGLGSRDNAEGWLVTGATGRVGVPFVSSEVERFTKREPTQAAGAALLALAWRHRDVLLAR